MGILSHMKKLIKNYIRCGILGWCLEILFTAFHSFKEQDYTLIGYTSLYMFPIYGMAAFLAPMGNLLKGKCIWLRGLLYALCIFIGEYSSGWLLKKKNLCPWDYSHCKWSIHGLIRLDYLPFWFIAGLLFERLVFDKES